MREDIVYLWLFGLATEDDDGQSLNKQKETKQTTWVDYNATISEEKVEAFQKWIETNNIKEEAVFNVLEKYGYTFIGDIKNKDLKKITNELQGGK